MANLPSRSTDSSTCASRGVPSGTTESTRSREVRPSSTRFTRAAAALKSSCVTGSAGTNICCCTVPASKTATSRANDS